MRTSSFQISTVVLGLTLAMPCFATDFFVGAGPGCTHTTIQAAINSAASQPGLDRVLIASNQTYTAQALNITPQAIELQGGYANCNAVAPTPGAQTTISGQGGSADSVISLNQLEGLSLNLDNLSIVRGDETTTSFGGGLDLRGAGVVQLVNVSVAQNFAGYGGGIYVKGEGVGQLQLSLGVSTAISDNVAFVSGGGIYVEGTASLTAVSSPAGVFRNQAPNGFGGGIRIFGKADARIGAAGFGNSGFLFENSAQYGGAIAADSAGADNDMELVIFPTVLDRPVKIENNSATIAGGALYSKGDCVSAANCKRVILRSYEIQVFGNSAPDGAAAFFENESFNSTIWIATRGVGGIAGAVGCVAVSCNFLFSNTTGNTTGAIVRAFGGSKFDVSRMIMANNSGGYLVRSDQGFIGASTMVIASSLLVNNSVAQALLATNDRAEMLIDSTTITANTIATPNPVLRTNDQIELFRSIIWQPGTRTLTNLGGAARLFTSNILASDAFGLPFGPTIITEDPRFKQPSVGDYNLQAASPAVDFSSPVNSPPLDILNNPTGQDISLKADRFGTRDLGMVEMQSAGNLAYGPSFDVDLRGWDFNNLATFNTSNSSAATGSGSMRIFVPQPGGGFAVRSTGASQCVNIPGPGTYTLTGRGLPTGGFAVATAAVIKWNMRANPGASSGCMNAGVTSTGDLFLPSNWALPTTPATITISPAQWTDSTTIEIRLEVAQGGISQSTTLTANFDEISLTGVSSGGGLLFADGFE